MSKASNKNDSNDKYTTIFRTQYGEKLRVRLGCGSDSRTKQSFKAECDINTIMARYRATGVLPDMALAAQGRFLDVTNFDYQDAMNTVAGAQSLFNELPAEMRHRFKNDPGEFLAFTSDEKNREEMAQMGLLSPQAVESMRKAAAEAKAVKTQENPPKSD